MAGLRLFVCVVLLLVLAAPAAAQEASADLEITVSDGDVVIEPGDILTYTVVVGNRGPDAAAGVEVLNAIPDGVEFIAAETTAGNCTEAGGILTCTVGDLEPDSAARVLVEVEVVSDTTVENAFVVSSQTSDPDTQNNTVTELSSTIEVLPLTGLVEQVLLPLASASVLGGAYLVFWARRQQSIEVVKRIR